MNWLTLGHTVLHYLYMILKLTALWWLLNIPFIFLGASLLAAPNLESVQMAVLIGVLLLPFIAVPATTAVLAVSRRYLRGDESFSFLAVCWRYYKREYKKSAVLGIIIVPVMCLFYVSLRYYAALASPAAIIFYILLVLLPFYILYMCSFLVDQELPWKAYVSNTLFLWIKKPLNALLAILDIVAASYVLWLFFPPLLFFILPGLTAVIVTYFYQKSMSCTGLYPA